MSNHNIIVILNDHEVQGLSGLGIAATIELATVRRGAQGDLMATAVSQSMAGQFP